MTEHTVKAYGDELNHLTAEVARMGGLVEAYTEVARRLGIMNDNEPVRTSGPKLVK